MTLFQMLNNKVLIFLRRKKYYSMHYKMWDYIVKHLLYASEDKLSDTRFINDLKEAFIKDNNCGVIFENCFFCALYNGTQIKDCDGCPLYKLQGGHCACSSSIHHIVQNRQNDRFTRIEAAKMIRDCVLRKGGK